MPGREKLVRAEATWIQMADVMLAVSQHTKDDIADVLRHRSSANHCLQAGRDDSPRALLPHSRRSTTAPFLLYVRAAFTQLQKLPRRSVLAFGRSIATRRASGWLPSGGGPPTARERRVMLLPMPD